MDGAVADRDCRRDNDEHAQGRDVAESRRAGTEVIEVDESCDERREGPDDKRQNGNPRLVSTRSGSGMHGEDGEERGPRADEP